MIFRIFATLALLFPLYLHAADMKQPPMVWGGLGAGSTNVTGPEDTFDATGMGYGEMGGQFRLFGPVFLPLAAFATLNSGTMKYRYRGKDSVNYSADDIKFSSSWPGFRGGVQIRIVNSKVWRLYVEGGLYGASGTIHYTTTETAIPTQGSQYEKSQKNVWDSGNYAELGNEIMFGKWGVRLAARRHAGRTGTVHAIDEQRYKYESVFGYIAVVHEIKKN